MAQTPRDPVIRDFAFNVLGQSWGSLLNFFVIPILVKVIGMESFGLLGFYLMLQSIVGLLDFGIGATFRREVARYRAEIPRGGDVGGGGLKALEVLFIVSSVLSGFLLFANAHWIAGSWLNATPSQIGSTAHSIRIMGAAATTQLLLGFYHGWLISIQRQGMANVLMGVTLTIRSLVSVGLIIFLKGGIDLILVTHLGVNVGGVLVLAVVAHRTMGTGFHQSRIAFVRLSTARSFAIGAFGVNVGNLVLANLDKIAISKFLPLDVLGQYALAQTLSGALWLILQPIGNAIYPRFNALLAEGDREGLSKVYHLGAQFTSILLAPAGIILMLFPRESLLAWTGSWDIASSTSRILVAGAFGMLVKGSCYIPGWLQTAAGILRIPLTVNAVVILLFCALLGPSLAWGSLGPAYLQSSLNLCYLAGIPIMHLTVLRGEFKRWLTKDLLLPLLTAFLIVYMARFLWTARLERFVTLTLLAAIWIAAVAASARTSSYIRMQWGELFRKGSMS